MYVLEHIPFKYVTIKPDKEAGSAGHVEPRPSPKSFHPDYETDTRTRLRVEALVRISYAGQVAEQLLTGRRSWNRGSQDDAHNAINVITYLGSQEDTLRAYCDLLLLQTRDKLRLPWNWDKVKAVASALLEKETLSYREVHRIIREVNQAEWGRSLVSLRQRLGKRDKAAQGSLNQQAKANDKQAQEQAP